MRGLFLLASPFHPYQCCIPDFRPDGNRSFETDGPLHLPDRRQEQKFQEKDKTWPRADRSHFFFCNYFFFFFPFFPVPVLPLDWVISAYSTRNWPSNVCTNDGAGHDLLGGTRGDGRYICTKIFSRMDSIIIRSTQPKTNPFLLLWFLFFFFSLLLFEV